MGDLPPTLGKGSWQKWAADRLSLKRSTGTTLKARLVLRNLSSKLLVAIACSYGVNVPMPPGSAGGLSGFLFHAFFFARACFVVLAGSVYVALGVRMFESMMLRMHRTRALPLLVSALVLASYVLFALVLLLFEHGDWQGVAQLQRERNVWVVMFGAVTMQAGAVQALGALADSYRYEACFSMSCVGATAGVREAQMIGALAKHLKGVAAADISLSAKASTIKEGDAFAAMASGLAAKMMKTTPEARAAQRLLEKARLREAEVEVTEVTVTIATKHKLVAKQVGSACRSRIVH